MNINKKFDRVKQWAGEKMGQEAKTEVSEEFKSLEMEMQLRHEGMEKLQKSMTVYVKSLSKRNEGDDREKMLPVAHMGQTMIHHGEDFEPDSEFGNCLIAMGRTNDRIARIQDSYVASATTGWLESLERSLAMMKEYQSARKKLEQRRLAYDASLSKMQKAKKEDFRVEEELRSQKAKYEESNEDVFRRMQDIKEAEADSVQDLGAFLDAELEYYDRCRDELLKLKKEWPAANSAAQQRQQPRRHEGRSRSNTAHSYSERYSTYEEPIPEQEAPRPSIRSGNRVVSSGRVASTSRLSHHPQEDYSPPDSPQRPSISRSSTFQGPTSMYRESPSSSRMNSVPPPSDVGSLRATLRPTARNNIMSSEVFADPSDDSTLNSNSPDRSYGARSISPATSHGSINSRSTSQSAANGRKAPPPPPSRSKKPAPPPPMKRSDMSVRY
ncbi:bar domain-containing protein [Rutstroemia sp. NJR-2017a BBW]|nr:bar domain-containing protein [Rutstroemia sp. NJR-2017a BBW]